MFRALTMDEARPLYAAGRVVPLRVDVKRGRKVRSVTTHVPGSFCAFLPAEDGGRRLYRILPEGARL